MFNNLEKYIVTEKQLKKYGQNNGNQEFTGNSMAKAISIIGALTIAIGIIAGLLLFSIYIPYGLLCIFASIVTGLIILGFGEVINLLESIKNNTKK